MDKKAFKLTQNTPAADCCLVGEQSCNGMHLRPGLCYGMF